MALEFELEALTLRAHVHAHRVSHLHPTPSNLQLARYEQRDTIDVRFSA